MLRVCLCLHAVTPQDMGEGRNRWRPQSSEAPEPPLLTPSIVGDQKVRMVSHIDSTGTANAGLPVKGMPAATVAWCGAVSRSSASRSFVELPSELARALGMPDGAQVRSGALSSRTPSSLRPWQW